MAGAGFPAGYAHAHKLQFRLGQSLAAPIRILEMGVAAVDDEIARFQKRCDPVNDRIHRVPGGYEQHDGPGSAQQIDEIADRRCGPDVGIRRFFLFKRIRFFGIQIIAGHRKTLIGHIQQEIAAHHPQADQSDVASFLFHEIDPSGDHSQAIWRRFSSRVFIRLS